MVSGNLPSTNEAWTQWFLEEPIIPGSQKLLATEEILKELGERLFSDLKDMMPQEGAFALQQVTKQDCINYIRTLTINRNFHGYMRQPSVVFDNLAHQFPNVRFEDSEPETEHSCDIDFLGHVGDKAFGLQIKPVTAKANFGNYSPSDRMRASFQDFTEQFGGKVFLVYSLKGEVANAEVVQQIALEVGRLNGK